MMGIAKTRLVTFLALLLFEFFAGPCEARAQYFPELRPTVSKPVQADEALLLDKDNPLLDEIGSVFGCEVDYVFRADGGSFRRFGPRHLLGAPGAAADGPPGIEIIEEVIVSNPPVSHLVNPVQYQLAGLPIFVGVGRFQDTVSSFPDFNTGVLVSFALDHEERVHAIDFIACSSPVIHYVAALDLDADGLLNLVCPVSHGVSGGGVIDVLKLNLDGKFEAAWGPTRRLKHYNYHLGYVQSSLESAYANCGIYDLNGDGFWEIETVKYISYGGGSGSYAYSVMYSFCNETGGWHRSTDQYSSYFLEQRRFYEWLLPLLESYEKENTPYLLRAEPDGRHFYGASYGEREIVFNLIDIHSSQVRKLLESWDRYPGT